MVPVHYFGAASNTDSALETVFAVLVGRFRNSAIFVAPALPPDSDTQPRAGTARSRYDKICTGGTEY